jgi:hypothetical protein
MPARRDGQSRALGGQTGSPSEAREWLGVGSAGDHLSRERFEPGERRCKWRGLGKGRFWSGEAGYPPAMTVRVAFAGAGFIAARHLQALDTFEDVQIVGVADVVPGRARSLAEQVGARAYDGHRAMLQAEDADALYICVPPRAHGDPEAAAIERDLPFFVEKPIALDEATAVTVAEGVRRRELVTATAPADATPRRLRPSLVPRSALDPAACVACSASAEKVGAGGDDRPSGALPWPHASERSSGSRRSPAGRFGRPISDLSHDPGETERRAWRAGWRLGHEEAPTRRAEWEAGVRACGRGAPRRAA